MKAKVLIAHPYPQSFNHAIFDVLVRSLEEEGVTVYKHDLYREGFNPVLTAQELGSDTSTDFLVNKYASELIEADMLFFIHPNWWGQPPAMLKGYVDRVIRPPYAYDFPAGAEGGQPTPKLTGKFGAVFITSNTSAQREEEIFGDPLEKIWKQCTFGFCGIQNYHRRMFRIVAESTEDKRKQWLGEVKSDVKRIVDQFPGQKEG